MRIFKRTQYDIRRKRGAFGTSFLAVFLVFICRFFCFGFNYYPQLNDYSYGIIVKNAVLFTVLLGVVYSLAIALFLSLLEKLFNTSWMFVVIASALPLAIEGSYVLSNSIRIIPGLFFAAASVNCFYYCLLNCRKRSFVACLILLLLCTFFSPYAAILTIALNICTLFTVTRDNKRAGVFIAIETVLAIVSIKNNFDALFLAQYNNTIDFVRPSLFEQIYLCFFEGGYYTVVYGFIRGLMAIVKESNWLYLALIVGISVFFALSSSKSMTQRKQSAIPELLSGFGLIFASIISIFLNQDFLTFSNATVGIIGFALIFDATVSVFIRSNKAVAFVASAILCVFCICSVSEISDYRETFRKDEKIVSDIMENVELSKDVNRVAILNLEPCYVSEQNYHYGEHIVGATASPKSLTGAINFFGEDKGVTYIPISLKNEEIYNENSFGEKALSSADKVYLYSQSSGELKELFIHYLGDGEFELCFENDELFGKLVEKNHIGMFFEEN